MPSVSRALQLDDLNHHDLADSLEHIVVQSENELAELDTFLTPLIEKIRNGLRLNGVGFGYYYELVDSIIDEDADNTLAAAKSLSSCPSRADKLAINYRGSPEHQLVDRAINLRISGEENIFGELDQKDAPDFPCLIHEGFALLNATFPQLAGEVRALVHEIILAHAQKGAKLEFDGASHYQFWGLLFLNPKHHKDRLAVAEVLAHEAGHSLLFGLMRNEPLVLNPDADRFKSPLRRDPRPMEGIFHATFVSARMALAMETLAKNDILSDDERQSALSAAQKDRENFQNGDGVIREHGKLTTTGAAIIESAREWINSTAPVS